VSPIPPRPPVPDIVFATSVTPSDTSSSIVLDLPRGEQIRIGRIRVEAYDDIVYATRDTDLGQRLELALDLLVAQTEAAKPLVVYLTGGGFVISPKEGAAERRRYVAEAGYAVASVRQAAEPRQPIHAAAEPVVAAPRPSAPPSPAVAPPSPEIEISPDPVNVTPKPKGKAKPVKSTRCNVYDHMNGC